ncbi:MAG: PilZ domain-containing protein [Candidatus Omnitrophica bacterium]|nr:PilZ domain-containing protein [Candidatus Omnitrophota bacterium]
MAKKFDIDRRKGVRAKRILSVQYRLFKGKGTSSRWYLSTTQDMSYSGIAFLSEVPFKIDDILELNVVMSGVLDVIEGYGQVVRVIKKEHDAQYVIAVKLLSKSALTRRLKDGSTKSRVKKVATKKKVKIKSRR